jgi:hypothetical protein
LLFQYPSRFVAHVAPLPRHRRRLRLEPAGLRPDHTARPLRQSADKEPNMNDVLDFVLGAHGGLNRWLSAQRLLSG